MRIDEHQALARNGHPELSAVAAHAWEEHRINLQVEVPRKEKSGTERKVEEYLLIRQHRHNVKILDKGYDVTKLGCSSFP